MKKSIINAGKYLLGIALGGLFLYLAFSNTSKEELLEGIREAKLEWLLLSMGVGLFSHYLRAVRWGMQMRASGYNPTNLRLFAAVMTGYLVNQAIPRGGELARCTILTKSDKIPLSKGLGTVVIERVFDLLILVFLIMLAFLLEYQTIDMYLKEAMGGGEEGGGPSLLVIGLIAMAAGGGIFLLFRKQILRIPIFQKLESFAKELLYSALSIRYIKNPGLFILLTVLIWVCYILMTYVAFFSISEIASIETNLFYFATIVTIMGGIGMAMPVPGGTGPYHAAVIFTFVALNIAGDVEVSRSLGSVFGIMMHASQLIMMVVFGLIGYIYLALAPSINSEIQKQETEPVPVS